MKKILLGLTLFLALVRAGAQDNPDTETKSGFAMPSRDFVMLQVGYDTWTNTPDSVKIGGLGRSFNTYLCYDFPIMKSNFSFAAGLGVSSSNIFFKDQELVLTDTTGYIQFVPETRSYKKYKLSLAYLEAPFEIRFFGNKENRNKGFKMGVGLKVGTLLSSHTKGKRELNNKPIIEKVNTKRYLETWRYAATARIGYGNFSVFGTYSLNGLFKVNSGPENLRPVSIGICLSGL